MTAPTGELLARLLGLGVRLRLEGDVLRYDAPRGVMTPELVDALRAAKPEILAAARPQTRTVACVGCGRFHFVEPSLCYWCRQAHYRQPAGEPCPGCREECEDCLGADHPDTHTPERS